jgi:hypothetical protein
MTIITLAILMMTSCSKSLNKTLSQEQFQEVVDKIPEAPKLDAFNIEEQKRIALLPPLFKQWVYEMLLIIKCLKHNQCE